MLKVQRFWSNWLKEKVNKTNNALKTKNYTESEEMLQDFISDLKNPDVNWKDRVAICFILEQMAAIDPFVDKIVDALMNLLAQESGIDPHVKEFAVWALGKIVEDSNSLDLIKLTMPTIVKFLNDDSEQVKTFATELHSRLSVYMKEKEVIDTQINEYREQLMKLIEEKLNNMKERSDAISREALGLNYQTAYERQDEMKKKIQEFNEQNQIQELEIQALETELIKKMKAFAGESREILRYWRKQRGEKEDLIRRVECILRIQSKIYTIIQFIIIQGPKDKITINDLTDLTKKKGRPYSEKEIINILQELVDQEIIPNFMLDQIKDYQIKVKDYLHEENSSKNETEKKE